MRDRFLLIVLALCIPFTLAVEGHAQTYSLLSNINCGSFGTTTKCYNEVSGTSGAISCSCTANCVGDLCIRGTVSASRTTVWGAAVPPTFSACTYTIVGVAKGGPATFKWKSRQSGLLVSNYLGNYNGTPNSSRQQDDCYYGTVLDEQQITGFCAG